MDRPRALVIDDGELERAYQALERAGLAPLRASGADVRDGLAMPCDLLITSGARTLAMPCLDVASPGPAPTWICMHTQDFHPLRERLRGLGVHYLVQASADDRTLDLFLAQMLHRGRERRRDARLPVGCELRWNWKKRTDRKAALLDLSPRGVRIAIEEELPIGAMLELELPAQLTGEAFAVAARVARCEGVPAAEGDRFNVLLMWEELEPQRRDVIDQLLSGTRIGPRVAPLAPRPYVDGAGIPDWGEMQTESERRRERRGVYEGHVDAFGSEGPIAALGRDLSMQGVRIDAPADTDSALDSATAIEIGDDLTIALHSGDAAEPVLVPARVARRDDDGALLLLFRELDEATQQGIARILESLPALCEVGAGPNEDESTPDENAPRGVFAAEIQRH